MTQHSETRRAELSAAGFASEVQRTWWFIAAQALAALVVVVIVAAVTSTSSSTYTARFVLHPGKDTPVGDVANLENELQPDGPVVQTVLKVLSSSEILHRAAIQAGVPAGGYTLDATVSPGSNYFVATIEGPHGSVAAKLGQAYESVASAYVETSYRGYTFDQLGNDSSHHNTFPPGADVLLLALVLGAALAVGELFLVYAARELRAGAGAGDGASDRAAPELEPDAEPEPEDATGAGGQPEVVIDLVEAEAIHAGAKGNGNGKSGGNGDGKVSGNRNGKQGGVPAKVRGSRPPRRPDPR
jgi:hypothetical protein